VVESGAKKVFYKKMIEVLEWEENFVLLNKKIAPPKKRNGEK
jgi:hypothetical protein